MAASRPFARNHAYVLGAVLVHNPEGEMRGGRADVRMLTAVDGCDGYSDVRPWLREACRGNFGKQRYCYRPGPGHSGRG